MKTMNLENGTKTVIKIFIATKVLKYINGMHLYLEAHALHMHSPLKVWFLQVLLANEFSGKMKFSDKLSVSVHWNGHGFQCLIISLTLGSISPHLLTLISMEFYKIGLRSIRSNFSCFIWNKIDGLLFLNKTTNQIILLHLVLLLIICTLQKTTQMKRAIHFTNML